MGIIAEHSSIRSDLDYLTGRRKHRPCEQNETLEPLRKRQRTAVEEPTGGVQDLISQHNATLAEETALPKEVILATIDAYFMFCHTQPYCFFHEANFRMRFAQGSIPKHLMSAVLATAIRFTPHPYFGTRVHEIAVGYANHSWKCVVADSFATSQRPDISLVQTISLLGLFDFTGKLMPRCRNQP